jgi:hypothetical protein
LLEISKQEQNEEIIQKRNSLLEKQISLQKELVLIEKNANQEVLKEVERVSGLNTTERILEEQEAQRAILEERKKINEAIANQESINLDEILDLKNRKTAEELLQKRD